MGFNISEPNSNQNLASESQPLSVAGPSVELFYPSDDTPVESRSAPARPDERLGAFAPPGHGTWFKPTRTQNSAAGIHKKAGLLNHKLLQM